MFTDENNSPVATERKSLAIGRKALADVTNNIGDNHSTSSASGMCEKDAMIAKLLEQLANVEKELKLSTEPDTMRKKLEKHDNDALKKLEEHDALIHDMKSGQADEIAAHAAKGAELAKGHAIALKELTDERDKLASKAKCGSSTRKGEEWGDAETGSYGSKKNSSVSGGSDHGSDHGSDQLFNNSAVNDWFTSNSNRKRSEPVDIPHNNTGKPHIAKQTAVKTVYKPAFKTAPKTAFKTAPKTTVNPYNTGTVRCKNGEKCSNGTSCGYIHTSNEKKLFAGREANYKTQLCKSISENMVCKYGDKCKFIHPDDENEWNHADADADY
jgi:hypothetical protein